MKVSCGKGCTWTQRSDTGHCAACHRTFDSLEAFDRHQSIKDGKSACADPSSKRWYSSREEDGMTYWHRKAP